MPIGPSFAPGYVGPGTFTKVILENQPPTALPQFVTAIVGRTSPDKPTSTRLVRNQVASQTVSIDPVTGILTISTGDTDEVIRRDVLTDDNVDLIRMESDSVVVDAEAFQSYFFGFNNDWIHTEVAAKTYVEWITDYAVKTVGIAPIFIGKAGVGTLPVLAARATDDPLFSIPVSALVGTIRPGTATLRIVRTAGPIFTLAVKATTATAFGTAITVTAGGTFTIINNGTNGDDGEVQVVVDAAALAAALTINGTYDDTVLLSSVVSASAYTLTTPNTIPDGVATFRLTVSAVQTVFNLSVKGPTATGFGPAVVVTAGGEFTIVDSGVGGSGGSVRVTVDDTLLVVATFPTDTDYDNTVTLATRGPRAGTATVTTNPSAVGAQYTVNYQAKKAIADFLPVAFDSLGALQVVHGSVDNSTPVDALSVGAYPYFTEGGLTMFAVPLKDKTIVGAIDGFDLDEPTGSGYTAAVEAALLQLEDVAEVCLVIVLSPTEAIGAGNFRPGILNAVLSHVNRMSAVPNRKPRMAILGARAGTVSEATFSGTASAAKSNRIVYLAPSTATLELSGVSKVADGGSLSAAIAGILSSGVDAGEPITKKRLVSFVDVPDTAFTLTQKNRLAGSFGLTIIEKVGGAPTIRHFLTTDVTNVLTAEAKVTVLEIDIRRSIQVTLDATIIGSRLVGEQTLGEVRTNINFVLDRKRTNQTIREGEIVSLKVDPAVPNQINVELKVLPVFDVDWVLVTAVFAIA
jgi:hypothetical protein